MGLRKNNASRFGLRTLFRGSDLGVNYFTLRIFTLFFFTIFFEALFLVAVFFKELLFFLAINLFTYK